MALRDIIAYLCQNYPYKQELTKGRLTKLVYLADWEGAKSFRHQLTTIAWEFNHFGPFVFDVYNEAASTPSVFTIQKTFNAYGSPSEIIRLVDHDYRPSISTRDRKILDKVIAKTSPMTWTRFIALVYATYPVRSRPRYADLPLVEIADEMNAQRRG